MFWHVLKHYFGMLSDILSGMPSAYLTRGWGPAGNITSQSSRLRSGGEHCLSNLAVAIRSSRGGGGGGRQLTQNLTTLTWQVGKNAKEANPESSAIRLKQTQKRGEQPEMTAHHRRTDLDWPWPQMFSAQMLQAKAREKAIDVLGNTGNTWRRHKWDYQGAVHFGQSNR